MNTTFLVAALVTALAGGGVFVNETTHGGLSEMMGLGHRHMFDQGGYHCSAHDDAEHAAAHGEHMHGDGTMPHDHCPGGAGMHDGPRGGGMHG